MKKTIRIILSILLIVLLAVGIIVSIGLFNPRTYEGVLNKLVYKKTGYQYSTNELSIQLSPTIISIKGLELINPDWVENSKLLTLQDAQISIDVAQIFNKQLPFWNAVLNDLEIQLIEDGKGQLNWNTLILLNQPKPEVEEPLVLKNLLSFSEVKINQAKIRQEKHEVSEEIDISSLLVKRASDSSVQLQGEGVYQEQKVAIDGSIGIDDQNLAEQILQFTMHAKGLDIDLQATGAINPLNMVGTKVSLNAKSDNLEKLEKLLATTFPAVTPIDVSLELISSKDSYEVSKINLLIGESILTGDVFYNLNDSFIRINLASEKIDFGSFSPVNREKNDDIKETTDTTITQEAEIDWTWMGSLNSEVNLDVGEISINEHSVKDITALLKFNKGVLDIDNLSALYQWQNADNIESSFASDMIKISGRVKPLADKTQGKDVQLAVSVTENNSSLALEGDVNLNGIGGNVLKINADVTNLDSLAKYLQSDFASYLPAKVNAHIATSENEIKVHKLTASFKDSDISGDIKLNWSGDIVKTEGKLVSRLLDLSSNTSGSKENKNTKHKEEKIFSDEPIDWSWLEIYDINFDLGVEKLIADNNVFNKVETKIQLGDGRLSVKPFRAFFANGSLKSVLTLEKIEDDAILDVQLDAINLSLAALGATSSSVLEGGTTDVVMDLNGKGASPHKIMSSLNGEMVAEVQKGIIKNDAFEAIGTDIVLEMLTMLNPFMKEDETTELECAAVKFTAKDGVFTSKNQMAVETTKMKIVGGGFVDMNTEALEIGFSPSAKKGIGVNVGSLVKFVRLGGSLSNPHPEADPVGLLKSGAAIGAAVSTGGLSLLVEGLFKRATNSGSACNQALKDIDDQEDDIEIQPLNNELKTSE